MTACDGLFATRKSIDTPRARRHACAETIRANRSADHMAVIDDRGNHRHTLGHRTQPLSFPRQTSRCKRRKTQIIDTSDKTKTLALAVCGWPGIYILTTNRYEFVLSAGRSTETDTRPSFLPMTAAATFASSPNGNRSTGNATVPRMVPLRRTTSALGESFTVTQICD